ncbi:serine hydrolase [Pedobacter lusitanus]|uniref:serine hydrolase n=1 Tax=Pedobacter lusitanus TaxID=1503925 RepID=UPI001364CE05|nr:serine hydrolase [Pedobacter lusitanus]
MISKKADAQVSKKLDTLFQTLVQQNAFSGSVLVADHGKPIYQKSFGYTNQDTKVPIDKNTMFELASIAKQFTAMAIVQLHQKGKLKYEDTLKRYFPELPYSDITINDLVHHTSGIPDFLGWGAKEVDITKINFNKDILESLQKNKVKTLFKPGVNTAYSNTNYVLLALIAEKVSGIDFATYLRKNIFGPLNMMHTQVYGQRYAKNKINNYAYGYIYDPIKDKYLLSDSTEKYQLFFDGVAGPYGISSTAEDLLKWDQALYTEKLANKQEIKNVFAPYLLKDGKPAELMGFPYGFGWMINEPQGFYLHTGGYPGYATLIVRYFKNQTVIVLMNNYNRINIYELGFNIENIINNREYAIPEVKKSATVLSVTAEKLVKFAGEYRSKDSPDFRFTIVNKDNQLYAQLTGQSSYKVYPETQNTFFYTAVEAKIVFAEDKNGRVVKLTLKQNGRELEFIKT